MRAIAGPRFGVETTFIVGVAVVAGLLELPLSAVLLAVFGAWVLVAVAEVAVARRAAARPRRPDEPVAVPASEPERLPLAAVPGPEPEPVETFLGADATAATPTLESPETAEPRRAWNVWELERRLQSRRGSEADDLAYLLLYLREYANAEGDLPVEFDALVRESFGELVEAEP